MAFDFSKLKILVVEDLQPMRLLFISVLRSLGVKEIDDAANGQEAFDLFTRENHDIILTDWMMPTSDGLELTHKVRHDSSSPNRMTPIILITGYSAWSRVETSRDKGVTEFLIKPFTAADIAKRLAHVITKPRDFIEINDFFGPDRRRQNDETFDGPERRKEKHTPYTPPKGKFKK